MTRSRIIIILISNVPSPGPQKDPLPQRGRLCMGGGGEVSPGANAGPAVHPGEEADRRPVPVDHEEGGQIPRAETEDDGVRRPLAQVVPRGELLQGQDQVDLAGKVSNFTCSGHIFGPGPITVQNFRKCFSWICWPGLRLDSRLIGKWKPYLQERRARAAAGAEDEEDEQQQEQKGPKNIQDKVTRSALASTGASG